MMTRLGSQQPTFHTVGTWASSDGDEAVELFGHYGISFYESQEYELRLFLARDEEGRFACRTIAISKPRQNGKSFAARHYSLWMAGVEGKNVLYSAHHGKTVRKMFKAMKNFVKENPDWLKSLVPNAGIYSAEGREGIYFANGGMIEFATRTNKGGRGETYDIIVVDEAQELTDEEYDALMPTTIASESGDPQKIYIGTPPNEKCPGTVFKGLHDKAHAGRGGNVWWLEWAADRLGDVHNVDLWYATNPALGYRIREDVFANEADSATSVDGFFREYLGWWSRQHVDSAIGADGWERCAIEDVPRLDGESAPCFAVKFSLDGKRASIAAAAKMGDGRVYVEVPSGCNASCARGIRWVEDFAASVAGGAGKVVIDGKAHADDLYRRLRGKKVSKSCLDIPMSSWVADACSSFVTAIDEGTIAHAGQQAVAYAVDNTTKRKIGNGGGFGFEAATEDADETLLEAMALAYQAAMTNKRNPKRKARAGC